jgi:hypothetical protein
MMISIYFPKILSIKLTWARTDIEQEVNGLYTFDRKEKLDAEKVKLVMEKAMKLFYSKWKTRT